MTGPHADQPLVTAGASPDAAAAAVVLVHGRGATARSILGTVDEFHREGVAYLAPQAAGNSWYPNPFTAPVESNEPGRTSGLAAVADAVREATGAGVPGERVVLLGFSQGACLVGEFAARNPARYGGVVVLSGGLIGEEVAAADYDGDLERTPVFLGCSDADPHIPEERVHESAAVFERLNGDVTTRVYEGMGHEVNRDELDWIADLLEGLVPESG